MFEASKSIMARKLEQLTQLADEPPNPPAYKSWDAHKQGIVPYFRVSFEFFSSPSASAAYKAERSSHLRHDIIPVNL